MGIHKKPDPTRAEEFKRLLGERFAYEFGWQEQQLKYLNVKESEWPKPGTITITFENQLTFAMLKTVSEVFGTDQIDIEGRHGSGSYDFGLEVELTVYTEGK